MGRAAVISKGHLLTKRQPPGLWVLGGEELRQAAMIDNGTPVEKMTASWPVGLGHEESLPLDNCRAPVIDKWALAERMATNWCVVLRWKKTCVKQQ